MTDDAEESAETLNVTHGLLIQVDGTWHHSEEFDGETYHTACGLTVEEPWTVRRPPASPDGGVCGDCFPQPGSAGDERSTDGGEEVATDGGNERPTPCDWPYEAVIHGNQLAPACLAQTSDGTPCTNTARGEGYLCGLHERANDPSLLPGAHQWAWLNDIRTDQTIAVCVACETIWTGGVPAISVACPSCDADVGQRCSALGYEGSGRREVQPHQPRRDRARLEVVDYDRCPEYPDVEVDDRQQRLTTDGGSAVRLYYTTGNSRSGGDRKLHPDDTCDHLDAAKNVKGCPATNAPRGQTCKDCSQPGLGGLKPSEYARRLAEREQPVPDGGPNGGDRQ